MKNCTYILDLGHNDKTGFEKFEKQKLYHTDDIYEAAQKLVEMYDRGYDAINLYWRGKSENDGKREN